MQLHEIPNERGIALPIVLIVLGHERRHKNVQIIFLYLDMFALIHVNLHISE